jgi:hypothetical protein
VTNFLVDFDSTLSNTFVKQIEWLNHKFRTNYTEEDFLDWGLPHLTSEEIAYLWSDECFLDPVFQLSCDPLPYAVDKVQQIIDRGDTITVVSDRPQELFSVTRMWLANNLTRIVPLVFTRSPFHTSVIHNHSAYNTKSQVSWNRRLTTIVEDAPHHSYALAQREYVDKVYMLDKPNNRDVHHPKIQRIQDWREVA